jgi:hypothetical protein
MAVNEKLRSELPKGVKILDNASYDNSIIGITFDDRLVYSYERMIQEYAEDNNCSIEDAIEWIDFNTVRALPYFGENAPIIVYEFEGV